MKTVTTAALAGLLTLTLGVAAQAQTIPSPTNPTPDFPVATNGSPLPYHGAARHGPLDTRSAYAPVAAPFNAVVETGAGVADTAVGAVGVR